jgi:hypothetical protein
VRLTLPSSVCAIDDEVLSALVTLRGPGTSRTPTVSELRLDEPRRQVNVTLDVGTLTPGEYLLQVIVDPSVASTTVPLLVAADRSREPLVPRTFERPCQAPQLTTAGTVFCREPGFSGQEHGWRVERPDSGAVSWPTTLDVKTAGEVVWTLERDPDGGLTVRRRLDVDGGLVDTHTGNVRTGATSFDGVSRARAFSSLWHVHAEPGVDRFVPLDYGLRARSWTLAPDDEVPVSLEGSLLCHLLTGSCEVVTFTELVADDGAHGWLTQRRLNASGFRSMDSSLDVSAMTRPLGVDSGVLRTILLPGNTALPLARPSGDVFGALVFSTDAGVFRGRLVQGAFALERLPPLHPIDVTRDWVVSQPSPTTLELFPLGP